MVNYPGIASKLLVVMVRVAARIAIFLFLFESFRDDCALRLLPAFANQTAPESNNKVHS
jgi:hypothetical protein